MRLLINGVPQVCAGLTDQSKCGTILKYCDPNDSTTVCGAKLVGQHIAHGTLPAGKSLAQHLYGAAEYVVTAACEGGSAYVGAVQAKTAAWYAAEGVHQWPIRGITEAVQGVGHVVAAVGGLS